MDCRRPSLGRPTATDDCRGTPVFTNNAPARFPAGTTVVTWTAADLSGNHTSATQTVTVDDRVPPAVACLPRTMPRGHGHRHGRFFQVFARDHCEVVTLRLGSFVLGIGETIKITETRKSGVRLVNVLGPKRIRHFHVGRGEAVIVATDGSDNTASAICR